MSIERTLLLTIFIILLSILCGYLIYNKLYLVNKEIKEKIIFFTDTNENSNNNKSKIIEQDIQKLRDREIRLKNRFFSNDETNITDLTPYIKSKLKISNIDILQYQEGSMTTTFSINGRLRNLLDFLYALYLEAKNYEIHFLSIKMINNEEFQGHIEISRLSLDSKPKLENLSKILRSDPITKLNKNLKIISIFGTSFISKTSPKLERKVNHIMGKTNKFSYIGTLKKSGGDITLFKDRKNSRVYQFEIGKKISEWTFKGKENTHYIFSKNNIMYEVEE